MQTKKKVQIKRYRKKSPRKNQKRKTKIAMNRKPRVSLRKKARKRKRKRMSKIEFLSKPKQMARKRRKK